MSNGLGQGVPPAPRREERKARMHSGVYLVYLGILSPVEPQMKFQSRADYTYDFNQESSNIAFTDVQETNM